MPGCVLRVHGRDLVSDETLSGLSLSACKIWRRGERRLPGSKMNRDVHETSGFSIVVSEQADLRAQVRDATRFLGDHRDELLTLGRQPAMEGMVLDHRSSTVARSAMPVLIIMRWPHGQHARRIGSGREGRSRSPSFTRPAAGVCSSA